MCNQFFARGERYVVGACPILQQREIGTNQDRWKLLLLAEHHSLCDQGIVLERVLDGLGCDEFSARGLDQILLSIRDRQKSILIDSAYIPSLEPAIHKCILRFVWTVPITFKYRRPTDQDLAIFRNSNFQIW